MILLMAFQWLIWTTGIVTGFSAEFRNPQREFQLCGRRNASYICDPDFILDIGDAERLNQLALGFKKSTRCLCSACENGISLGIFIKKNLTQEAAKEYPNGKSIAEMLRKRWHLGKCNDDIVIILLTEMKISEYSLGPAVQEIFKDETARLIVDDCKAHFLSGWYYQGLESVVTSFSDIIIRIQKEKKNSNKGLIIGLIMGVGVLLILLIFGMLLLKRQNKRRKSGCSNIYESVPTENKHEDFLNDKIEEYQLGKLYKQNKNEEESDEDNNRVSQQFLHFERQLSAVIEESEDSESIRDNNIAFNNSLNSQQDTNRPVQVTEL